jgi:8-oxo-dGTP pyrophosphatase MutT (NUDIX family)
MERARLIPLRRPPQIHRVEGRFVPAGATLDEVDAAWARVRARVPRAFDGPMLHVMGVSRNGHGGVAIHCVESSYRFAAAGSAGLDCGMRPLGVKGICRTPDGRVLMARRSLETLTYPGEWEFAPGGCMEPGVDPAAMVLRELREETGWTASAPPVARALAYDPTARSWEIVYALRATPPSVPVEGWECSELRVVAAGDWPAPLCAFAVQVAPLAGSVARAG